MASAASRRDCVCCFSRSAVRAPPSWFVSGWSWRETYRRCMTGGYPFGRNPIRAPGSGAQRRSGRSRQPRPRPAKRRTPMAKRPSGTECGTGPAERARHRRQSGLARTRARAGTAHDGRDRASAQVQRAEREPPRSRRSQRVASGDGGSPRVRPDQEDPRSRRPRPVRDAPARGGLPLADRVTVLCDGCVVRATPTADLGHDQLIELIVGQPVEDFYPEPPQPRSEVVLAARGLSGQVAAGIDLELRRDEIVGIAGLNGSGREELPSLLFGARRWSSTSQASSISA